MQRMNQPPLRPRHYRRTDQLVRRTFADIGSAALQARALTVPFTEAMRPKPVRPRLIATAEGAIARMLLTIPAYAVAAEPLSAIYRELLTELPASVGLVIMTHESTAGQIGRWLAESGRTDTAEVVEAPDHLQFSVWAEDGYVVVHDDDSGCTDFVEPFSFPRYGDSLVADFVANATDLDKTQAPLYFQGGNVLIGDDFFFIGADYPAESLRYLGTVLVPSAGESPAQLVHRLYGEYLDPVRKLVYLASTIPVPAEERRSIELDGAQWTEEVFVGNRAGTVQPIFHIDMFVALAGGKRVLVGDPRLAADLLEIPLQPHAMANVFDDIARSLSRLGFEVLRNPLPLVYMDDPAKRVRTWYFATSNNALVHAPATGRPAVFLPTYGHGHWESLAVTDRRNQEIWEGLGFDVRALGDFHPFAEELGALHCIKKYLARA
jgi:hypothetical protein